MVTPTILAVHRSGVSARPALQQPLLFDPARCLQPFTPEDFTVASRESARNRLGIPADRHVIISLGMAAHLKGPLPYLNALEQLHYWNVPSHLYCLGYIPPTYYSTILREVVRLRLTEEVHLWNRPSTNDAYRDLLIAADCAIQVHKHMPGTFSGALLDCLSAGLPTICNEDLAITMNTPRFVTTIPDELSPLLLAEQLLDLYKLHESHRHDDTYRTRNAAEHNETNYSPQILKLLLAS